jgi:hypothetical protein
MTTPNSPSGLPPEDRWVESDPDFIAWAEEVTGYLVPMIQSSAITVSLVPKGPSDIKFAVELGLSIMLDKPIIAVLAPGAHCPPALRRVAVEVIYWDGLDTGDLQAAIKRVMAS